MEKNNRIKKSYPEDFKTMFGLSTLNWTETITGAFMASLFMIYMTDFSGIGGVAALLTTVLLTGGRLFDAINDPLQGFIMDWKKPGRYGRYKPFIIASTIIATFSVMALFAIPSGIAQRQMLVIIK